MHYVIVIIVILCIIWFQVQNFYDTKHKIEKYKGIFPDSASSYSLQKEMFMLNDADSSSEEDSSSGFQDEGISVSQIHINHDSDTLSKIECAINKYLQKNKGAASDFHLMKDVVERYCDADEEEITTQQPIPLYLGLMGTMVGIIVGVVYIATTGGFSGENITNSVTELMTCVAIAMSASLFGVYCTTRISWSSKDAFSKVEAEKNRLYSWLQTELLPTLSGNTVNALYLLQQNLTTFNTTFQSNISGLSRALGQIKDTSSEQVELINLLQDIDIRRVAQANVIVLRELKDCTSELSRFNQYIHSVSDYLTTVNNLNTNINEHLNRTAAIERMGAFFEQEINQVTAREKYINEVVANVDDTLKKTFESLSESTQKGISELRNSSTRDFDDISKTMEAQQTLFREELQAQREQYAETLESEHKTFIEYLHCQQESLTEKSNEISSLVSEIHNFGDTKKAMDSLISISREQSSKLDELVHVFGTRNVMSLDSAGGKNIVTSSFCKIAVAAVVGLMIASVGVNLYSAITDKQSNDGALIEVLSCIKDDLNSLSKTVDSIQHEFSQPVEDDVK